MGCQPQQEGQPNLSRWAPVSKVETAVPSDRSRKGHFQRQHSGHMHQIRQTDTHIHTHTHTHTHGGEGRPRPGLRQRLPGFPGCGSNPFLLRYLHAGWRRPPCLLGDFSGRTGSVSAVPPTGSLREACPSSSSKPSPGEAVVAGLPGSSRCCSFLLRALYAPKLCSGLQLRLRFAGCDR